jgi:tight adherence protein C
MNDQSLLIITVAGALAMVGYFIATLFMKDDSDRIRERLKGEGKEQPTQQKKQAGVAPMLQRIGQAAAGPFMPTKREGQSALRKQLGYAGLYSPSAGKVIMGFKFILTCVGLILGYIASLFGIPLMLGLSVGGLLGFFSMKIWLGMRIKKNQRSLDYALPDALDLMVVCVEAGLTVDAAMQRVGEELALPHPGLSREFGIAYMETRVGLTRAESMRNLGIRTGCTSLQSLAAMMIQADRFGTSIANALRVHSESLRIARQHKAEEIAAKVAVKMTFPLVLFIFPATFIILAGPTCLLMFASPLFK